MTQEEKEIIAKNFAYGGHLSYIAVNKETGERFDFEKDELDKCVMIPITEEIFTAVMFGLNYSHK